MKVHGRIGGTFGIVLGTPTAPCTLQVSGEVPGTTVTGSGSLSPFSFTPLHIDHPRLFSFPSADTALTPALRSCPQ